MPRSEPVHQRALVRTYGPLAALGVLAMLISTCARHTVFPAYSWNRDELVYLWHMRVLRAGELTSTDGGFPRLFHPWLGGASGGELFSQYTLGWPLVLLGAELVFGNPGAALAFGALIAVVGTYTLARELMRDHTVALVAATVMTCSPILAIQGGIYLSYLFTLGLGLLFASSLISGVRLGSRTRMVTAGLLLGAIFLTRPYDALLWLATVGGYVALMHRRDVRRLARLGLWFAFGALPLFLAALAYNRRITGSFTQFPITAADPLDAFGFGVRQLMPTFELVNYNLRRATVGLLKNGFFLPLFAAGGYLTIPVGLVALWQRRREQTTIALLAIALAFPVGYFFFFGTHVSSLAVHLSGPIYYMPLYAVLSILMASVVVRAWQRRQAFGIGLVAVLAIATVPFAVNRLEVNHRLSESQLPWKRAVESIKDDRALVFVSRSGPYLMYLNPYSANPPDLDGRLLYSTDPGIGIFDAISAHADRTPYMEAASLSAVELLPSNNPRTPTISVTKLRVAHGDVLTLSVTVSNPTNDPTVAVRLQIGSYVEWRTVATDSSKGAEHTVEWKLGAGGEGIVPLVAPGGSIAVEVGFGTTLQEAEAHAALRREHTYRTGTAGFDLLLPGIPSRRSATGRWRVTADPARELAVSARGS